MVRTSFPLTRRHFVAGCACLASMGVSARTSVAFAEGNLTERQIIDALLGKSGGLRSAAPTAAASAPATAPAAGADAAHLRALLDKLESAKTRAFSVKQRSQDAAVRQEIASHVGDRPSVDMEVYFEFNAWKVTPAAAATLDKLGQALASKELASRGFLLEGHTDAKGKPEVNLTISQLRADAVRAYLISRHGMNSGLLRSIGYGEERLKLPANPNSAENRRVKVINLADGILSAR